MSLLDLSPFPALEDLFVSSRTFTSITVSWRCGSCEASAVGYTVRVAYAELPTYVPEDHPLTLTRFDTTNTTFTAAGLIPRTRYVFGVVVYRTVEGGSTPTVFTEGPWVSVTEETKHPPGKDHSFSFRCLSHSRLDSDRSGFLSERCGLPQQQRGSAPGYRKWACPGGERPLLPDQLCDLLSGRDGPFCGGLVPPR